METISLKLENEFLQDIEKTMKKHRYSTKTEFVREAIRDKLNELEKEELIKRLSEFKSNFKGKSKMSEEEAERLASLKIAKKFGISLD